MREQQGEALAYEPALQAKLLDCPRGDGPSHLIQNAPRIECSPYAVPLPLPGMPFAARAEGTTRFQLAQWVGRALCSTHHCIPSPYPLTQPPLCHRPTAHRNSLIRRSLFDDGLDDEALLGGNLIGLLPDLPPEEPSRQLMGRPEQSISLCSMEVGWLGLQLRQRAD